MHYDHHIPWRFVHGFRHCVVSMRASRPPHAPSLLPRSGEQTPKHNQFSNRPLWLTLGSLSSKVVITRMTIMKSDPDETVRESTLCESYPLPTPNSNTYFKFSVSHSVTQVGRTPRPPKRGSLGNECIIAFSTSTAQMLITVFSTWPLLLQPHLTCLSRQKNEKKIVDFSQRQTVLAVKIIAGPKGSNMTPKETGNGSRQNICLWL